MDELSLISCHDLGTVIINWSPESVYNIRCFGLNVVGNPFLWLIWLLVLRSRSIIGKQLYASILTRCNKKEPIFSRNILLRRCSTCWRYKDLIKISYIMPWRFQKLFTLFCFLSSIIISCAPDVDAICVKLFLFRSTSMKSSYLVCVEFPVLNAFFVGNFRVWAVICMFSCSYISSVILNRNHGTSSIQRSSFDCCDGYFTWSFLIWLLHYFWEWNYMTWQMIPLSASVIHSKWCGWWRGTREFDQISRCLGPTVSLLGLLQMLLWYLPQKIVISCWCGVKILQDPIGFSHSICLRWSM